VSWRGLRYKGTEILRSAEWNAAVDALNDLYGWLTDGTKDINVDEVFGRTAYFRERIYSEGRPVILDGDPITIYQFYDTAKSQITEAIDSSSLLSKIAEASEAQLTKLDLLMMYMKDSRDVLVRLSIDQYGNVGVRIVEPIDVYGYVPISISNDMVGLAKDSTLRLLIRALQSIGGDKILVFIADSGIMVPVDIQARYKPPGMILYGGTVTSSGNTTDIDVSLYSSIRLMVKVTSVGGTNPTLDIYIEGKYEATGDYVTLLSRENITSVGVYELGQLDNLCFRYIRVRWVVGGTSPSFTFTVVAQALV
jgi:hypothetical protein